MAKDEIPEQLKEQDFNKIYQELLELPHGGFFGVFKCGDFERQTAFKFVKEQELTEEIIKVAFKDMGEQLAILFRFRNEEVKQ